MSEHTNPNDGLIEDVIDVSRGTQTQGSIAESEILFEHLLGIRLPENINSQNVSDQIAVRICSTIDAARLGVTQANLSEVLNANITNALQRLNGGRNATQRLVQPDRFIQTQVIADAVRESIPQNVLNEFVRYGMPAALDANPAVPRFHIRMRVAIDGESVPMGVISKKSRPRDVTIDMRHAFWRERTFQNPRELAVELTGKTLQSMGITITNPSDVPTSYALSAADANRIAGTNMQVINLHNNYPEFIANVEYNGQPRTIRLNVNGLVSALVQTPADLAGRIVGSLDFRELTRYLSEDSNWDWVQGLNDINPTERITDGSGRIVSAVTYVVGQLIRQYGGARTGGMFVGLHNLHEIQKEQFTQHQYDTRLREDSDNMTGAAMATSLVMKYHDLRAALGGRERATVDTELSTASYNKQLLQMLEVLEASQLPTSSHLYSELESRISAIDALYPRVSGTAAGTPVTIPASGSMPTESMRVPARSGAVADYGPVLDWLEKRKDEAKKQMKNFEDIEARVKQIADFCTRNGIAATRIQTIADNCRAATRNPDDISQTIDLKSLADEVRSRRNLTGKTEANLDNDVERLQKELNDINTGKAVGIHGDAAQHLVIKEYLKRYRGLTESEAATATNYLRARGTLDGDLAQATEDISGDIYGTERLDSVSDWFKNVPNLSVSPEARASRIVYQIGYAAGVPMRPNTYSRSFLNLRYYRRNLPVPDWSQANYRSLMTAYFGMKKLYEGGGPNRLKLQQTLYVQQQMREISRALLSKHAQSLLKDFGPSLGLSEGQQKEALKNPTKAEHIALLEQTLQGDPPAGYTKKVEDAIVFADKHTDWARHTLLTNEKYGMLYGKNNKVSIRNLLYGNKYASVAGLGYRAPVGIAKAAGKGTSKAAKAVWARKGAIAAGALIGTLFLPGFGTAIGAAIGGGASKPHPAAS